MPYNKREWTGADNMDLFQNDIMARKKKVKYLTIQNIWYCMKFENW